MRVNYQVHLFVYFVVIPVFVRATLGVEGFMPAGLDDCKVYDLAVTPQKMVLAATDKGLYFQEKGKRIWKRFEKTLFLPERNRPTWMKPGLEPEVFFSVASDSAGVLYAGSDRAGLYRSKDDGKHWDLVLYENYRDLPIHYIALTKKDTVLAVSNPSFKPPAKGTDRKIAGVHGELIRSEDKGDTWKFIFRERKRIQRVIVRADNTAYFFNNDTSIFVSTNDGAEFSKELVSRFHDIGLHPNGNWVTLYYSSVYEARPDQNQNYFQMVDLNKNRVSRIETTSAGKSFLVRYTPNRVESLEEESQSYSLVKCSPSDIYDAEEDGLGRILLATKKGVFRYAPEVMVRVSSSSGGQVRVILPDHPGGTNTLFGKQQIEYALADYSRLRFKAIPGDGFELSEWGGLSCDKKQFICDIIVTQDTPMIHITFSKKED